MPGPPVTIGCAVILTPGAAGPPDSGIIASIPHAVALANGLPLATAQSICQMVNTASGAPYPLPISGGGSAGVTLDGKALLRVGDQIPLGPGVLLVVGPPAAPWVTDTGGP